MSIIRHILPTVTDLVQWEDKGDASMNRLSASELFDKLDDYEEVEGVRKYPNGFNYCGMLMKSRAKKVKVSNILANGNHTIKSEFASLRNKNEQGQVTHCMNGLLRTFNEFQYFTGLEEIIEMGVFRVQTSFNTAYRDGEQILEEITFPQSLYAFSGHSGREGFEKVNLKKVTYTGLHNPNTSKAYSHAELFTNVVEEVHIPNREFWFLFHFAFSGNPMYKGFTKLIDDSTGEEITNLGKIPESVTTLYACFTNAGNVTDNNFQLPSHIKSLSNSCFYNNSSIVDMDLTNVTSIGERVFQYCKSLNKVVWIPGSTHIPLYTFADSSLTTLEGIDRIKTVGNYAFRSCTGLTLEHFPESLESIGSYAFDKCKQQAYRKIYSEKLTTVGLYNAIYGLVGQNVESIEFPNLTSWGGETLLGNLKSLKTVKMPLVKSFSGYTNGNYNFWSDTSALGVFYNDTALEDIDMSSATYLGVKCFYGCANLTLNELPSDLETIHTKCFKGCTSLVDVTIGDKIKAIYPGAFMGCSNLKTIRIKATTPPTLKPNCESNGDSFYEYINGVRIWKYYYPRGDHFPKENEGFKIVVPEGCAEKYKAADVWAEYADYISE